MSLESEVIAVLPECVQLVNIKGSHVTVQIDGLSTVEKGSILLSLERQFHREIDSTLEVFLEAKTDMNKLRLKFRGVEMG